MALRVSTKLGTMELVGIYDPQEDEPEVKGWKELVCAKDSQSLRITWGVLIPTLLRGGP